ncbi:hypothetical protein ENSA5_45350 [Enhygromyxa salina]|uniref:Uncharacterized protein n=1 Tax=Enhygromyxa salina TaxID=215803 RepID=A0A2S9XJR9_9BACT|nr:hypothetical protein ENSA5_45350 [Enhygromyxa salina]
MSTRVQPGRAGVNQHAASETASAGQVATATNVVVLELFDHRSPLFESLARVIDGDEAPCRSVGDGDGRLRIIAEPERIPRLLLLQ